METSKHLRDQPDQPILFPEDSRASLFPSPGSDEAQKMIERSGRRCFGLSKKSGRLGQFVKMFLASSAWSSTRCFLAWADENHRKNYGLLVRLYDVVVDVAKKGEDKTVVWSFPDCQVQIDMSRKKYPWDGAK